MPRMVDGGRAPAFELLTDAFGRVKGVVRRVVRGLTPDQLAYQITPDANSIAWLVWHLTRIQDDHIAEVAGIEQVWTSAGFHDRFELPFDARDTGYGHSSKEVAACKATADLLTEYYNAVHEQTLRFIDGLDEADLVRIVDERYDPPVTLSVRLVSVVDDDLEHAGQAAYVRGLLPKD
jgi:hypothetical protein